MSDSEDDGVPRLSPHALAALREFHAEQEPRAGPGRGLAGGVGAMEENWVSDACPSGTRTCHPSLGS